jgi:hypothetical protein
MECGGPALRDGAATPLSGGREVFECLNASRTHEGGVALRFPPHSKTRQCLRKIVLKIRHSSFEFPPIRVHPWFKTARCHFDWWFNCFSKKPCNFPLALVFFWM